MTYNQNLGSFALQPASPHAPPQGLPPHLASISAQAIARANGLAGITLAELDSLRRDHRWQLATAFIAGGIVGGAIWGIANPPKPPTIISQPGPVQVIPSPQVVERNCLAFCGSH